MHVYEGICIYTHTKLQQMDGCTGKSVQSIDCINSKW